MNNIKIEIPLMTRPKKNSQSIVYNPRTKRPIIVQSKNYKEFERECGYFLKKYKMNINIPINLKCKFYVPDKRKRDIVNLLNAIQDVLVKYQVLEDDNYNIVQSVDGSKIIYQKGVEKTIIEISEVKNEKQI